MSWWTKKRKLRNDLARVLAEIGESQCLANDAAASENLDQECHLSAANVTDSSYTLTQTVHRTEPNAPHLCGDDDVTPLSDTDSLISDDEDQLIDDANAAEGTKKRELTPAEKLAVWALMFHISHDALGGLLNVLRNLVPDVELPKDPRTVLRTVTTKTTAPRITDVSDGQYYHFGLTECLQCALEGSTLQPVPQIDLLINIDGLPIFKSSNAQVWPIQGYASAPHCLGPFVIGVFHGFRKPQNLDFLEPFVNEFVELQSNGLTWKDQVVPVNLSAFVCDAVARGQLKNIKPHNGYSGCERCIVRGDRDENRVHFDEIDAERRTDESFSAQTDEHHHFGPTPLSTIGVGLVSAFVLDYMHLACLGVQRKLLSLWIEGPHRCRQGRSVINGISAALEQCKRSIPFEFARKPRSLSEFKRWKATEFRQFMLYTGPVVLLNAIPEEMYHNFLLFSVAMRILLHPSMAQEHADFAETLLRNFVTHFARLYGSEMVSYNVHSLIHLPDDARRHGPLDRISAFRFENNMASLKRMIRKPSQVLPQIIRRTSEAINFLPYLSHPQSDTTKVSKPHVRGPLPAGLVEWQQYGQVHTERFHLQIVSPDNFVVIRDQIFTVRNVLFRDGHVKLLCSEVTKEGDFFDYPVASEFVGLFVVNLEDANNLEVV